MTFLVSSWHWWHPNAVLKRLGNKRDLGIHTEMFSDESSILTRPESLQIDSKRSIPEERSPVSSWEARSSTTLWTTIRWWSFILAIVRTTPSSFAYRRDDCHQLRLTDRPDRQVCDGFDRPSDLSASRTDGLYARGGVSRNGKPIIALPPRSRRHNHPHRVAELAPELG